MSYERLCKTCKHWQREKDDGYDDIVNPPDPATFDKDYDATEEMIRAKWGHVVRHCKHPKIVFYQRPEINAAAVVDGSNYTASLLTGEQFGCVLHEAADPGAATKSQPKMAGVVDKPGSDVPFKIIFP